MRSLSVTSLAVALALAPAMASATSIATCTRYGAEDLVAPWWGADFAQPDGEARWSVRSGRLTRQTGDGAETEFPGEEWLASLAFPTPRDGWAVGESGAVLHTRDGGRTWERPPAGTTSDLRLVRCADASRCMIVAADGAVLRTGDGGRTWTTSPFRAPKDVADLFLRDDHAWMVSASGAIIDTHDGGATWQAGALESDSGGPPALSLVRFADRDLGWIASGERLLRTTDGGATWSETLRLEEGLSFLTVESPDGRQVVAGVQGPCASYEQSGGGFRSEDGGATWEDVVDAEEAGADWEALVQDPSATAGLTRAVRTSGAEPGTKSFSAVEAWPEREGLHMRTIVVQERPCGDIEIGAGEEPPRPGWEVGDPCRLDADRADEVLARFADRLPTADDALFVECGRERKTFHLPASIPRRRLARVSPSLVRLMDMADRMRPSSLQRHLSVRQREEGAIVVPLLRAGRFDAGMADPSALRALLDRYEGPLPPRGLVGSVEIDLPPDVSSRGVVPPRYPDIALMARVQGNVVLDLALDASGAVKEADVASGIPLLDTAALQAARAWRFAPGASAAVPIRVRLRFGLDHCGRGGLIFDF